MRSQKKMSRRIANTIYEYLIWELAKNHSKSSEIMPHKIATKTKYLSSLKKKSEGTNPRFGNSGFSSPVISETGL